MTVRFEVMGDGPETNMARCSWCGLVEHKTAIIDHNIDVHSGGAVVQLYTMGASS